MNIKYIVLLLLSCIVLSLLLYFKYSYVSNHQINQNISTISNLPPKNDNQPDARAEDPMTEMEIYADIDRRRNQIRKEQEDLIETFKNNKSDFYGKVINQYGHPVEYAEVEIQWLNYDNGDGIKKQLTTDKNGFFTFKNIPAASIEVTVKKEGYHYYYEDNRKYFWFLENPDQQNVYKPDPSKPYVFTIKKMGATEPLIYISKSQKVEDISKPVYYSLSTGKIVPEENADIKLSLNLQLFDTDKDQHGREFQWYEWSAIIDCLASSEIIVIKDSTKGDKNISSNEIERYIETPSDGWVKQYLFHAPIIEQGPNKPRYIQNGVLLLFYYKTREGKHGVAHLDLFIRGGKKLDLQIYSFLNPSGSRNIEFDLDKMIEQRD